MSTTWEGNLDQAAVSAEVYAIRPDYVGLLVVARGLEPGPTSPASEGALLQAEEAATVLLDGRDPQDLPALAEWRSAFAAFGVRPREARSSAEALIRRVAAGLPRIDRLTDLYNAVSVMHQIPIGGENLAGYVGPPRLVVATGEEPFDTVSDGAPVVVRPVPGEVVWRDDAGVTCRRWNWRQCVRTRLSTSTTDALFILDGLGDDAESRLIAAGAELRSRLLDDSPYATFDQRLLQRAAP